MDLVLSHTTAYRFWRSFSGDLSAFAKARGPRAMGSRVDLTPELREELAALGFAFDESHPLHLLFAESRLRSRVRGVESHVESRPLPAGSLLRLSANVVIVSPELCYAQMSEVVPPAREALVGMEFCGTYAFGPEGLQPDRAPLTSVKQLGEFCATFMGARSGASQTASAVIDGAASPMEARLALLLCLPTTRGGYGLPRPQLNARIELGRTARRIYEVSHCRADLFWPEAKLDVEYDGREAHDSQAHAADVARERALEAQGVTVMRITYEQVADWEAFDLVAKQIGARLGKYVRIRSAGFREHGMALRGELGRAAK